MTKTDALRHARAAVSIHGRGTSWTVIGPHDSRNLRGPSTEVRTDSYFKARSIAAGWKADVVLGQMGLLTPEASMEMADARIAGGIGNVQRLVEIGIKHATGSAA